MKKLFLYFIIFTTFLLNGCFNYKDIDKVLFVTSVIVDIDNNRSPVIYVEAFKPARGGKGESGKGERVLYKGTGKTIFEIVRDLNLSSSYKLNYTQNRGIIFTEKAARECLVDYIDFFDRDQELVVRSYLAIYKGDPQKLINAKLKEQEYIGLFIFDLIYNIPASSRGILLRLNDFLNQRYTKSKTSVVTMIAMKDDQTSSKIEVSAGAIIKNFKMVDTLPRTQAEGYNFLIDNIKRGTLEAGNPSAADKYITLEILKSKTDTKIYYDGDSIKVKKIINTKTSIADVQEKLNFTKENIEQLEKNAESNIKDACERLFDYYKGKDLDIFNVSDDFYRKYPRAKIDDVFNKSQLEVEAHVHVEGSSDKTNFN
ncbi:Ger(x)C family spore germination protein [Clostridium magnum]|uniref:Spore germination protein B3 n=1 Tax=Clostridium magnum DSM 2767 TaxID=1121326 RepID=A0A162RFE1_9CLOT|nr:Ger(x)C family spore germination protein [Clostridium magnum]KZL89821.1 spore germination protein B3 precursor [Clostridium magnum DSM 2767]SHI69453.1 germination protein, Ger(x)C family [Clostridium magnum DSM 2767]